jgi:hypothetical protein
MSAGVAQLKLIESRMIMMTAAECQLALLAPALERLSRASLPIKKRTLVAAAYVIGYDGTISREEAELFRAIAASIDCPMPIWEEGKSSE